MEVYFPKNYPLVVQKRDKFTLDVLLTQYLRKELFEGNEIEGFFQRCTNSYSKILLCSNYDALSYYRNGDKGIELSLSKKQLCDPNSNDWKYTSNSLIEDGNIECGNPLNIYIVEQFKPICLNHLKS